MPGLLTPLRARADQTAIQRGLEILHFVIAERQTATVETVDLELADHAGVSAAAAPEMLLLARERISRARHLIRWTLEHRANGHTERLQVPATPADKPNVGPMAPLQPRPQTEPPAGDFADLDRRPVGVGTRIDF